MGSCMVMLLVIMAILGLLYACIQDEKERRKFFLLVSIMGAVSLFLWLCAIMGIVSVGSNALSAMATLFFVRFAREGGKTKEKLQLGSMLSVMLLGLSACFSANDKDIVSFAAALLFGQVAACLDCLLWKDG